MTAKELREQQAWNGLPISMREKLVMSANDPNVTAIYIAPIDSDIETVTENLCTLGFKCEPEEGYEMNKEALKVLRVSW